MEDGATLIEYKTRLHHKEPKLRSGDASLLQLQLYALAYQRTHGVLPDLCSLRSIGVVEGDVSEISFVPTQKDLKAAEKAVFETWNAMQVASEKGGDFAAKASVFTCGGCPYGLICDAAAR